MRVRKDRRSGQYEPKKDKVINSLSAILERDGLKVRREKLKVGHGFRVMSGSCQALGEDLLFVDRRLPQDEQITFLIAKVLERSCEVSHDELQSLPPKVKDSLQELPIAGEACAGELA